MRKPANELFNLAQQLLNHAICSDYASDQLLDLQFIDKLFANEQGDADRAQRR